MRFGTGTGLDCADPVGGASGCIGVDVPVADEGGCICCHGSSCTFEVWHGIGGALLI